MPTSSGHSPRQAGGGNSLLPAGGDRPRVLAGGRLTLEWWLTPPAPGGPIPSPAGGVGGCRRGRGSGCGPGAAERRHRTQRRPDRVRHGLHRRISAGCRISPGCSTASRLPTGSRCWTRPSRRASRPVLAGFYGHAGLRPVLRLHEGLPAAAELVTRGLTQRGFDRPPHGRAVFRRWWQVVDSNHRRRAGLRLAIVGCQAEGGDGESGGVSAGARRLSLSWSRLSAASGITRLVRAAEQFRPAAGRAHRLERQLDRGWRWAWRRCCTCSSVRAGSGYPGPLAGDHR